MSEGVRRKVNRRPGVVSTKWLDNRLWRESRLKGGCSQDWLPHSLPGYLPDTTLAV